MWLTGCSTTSKGFLIAEKPVNTPATCWRLATSDTLSTRSPSLNSVTTYLETCVAVSQILTWLCPPAVVKEQTLDSKSGLPLPQIWPTCLCTTMTVPAGVPQTRTPSPRCPTLEQPLGPWLCLTSSPFHTPMTCRSPSMVDQGLEVQEVSTVVSTVSTA